MPNDTAVLEAQAAQRDAAKTATKELLRGKKRAEDKFSLKIGDELVEFHFVSIGGKAYDRMIDDCPATIEQQAKGATYNEDKFAPRLLAAVSKAPEMSEEDWTEAVWSNGDWSRGERMQLFTRAIAVCLKGLDVGPTAAG